MTVSNDRRSGRTWAWALGTAALQLALATAIALGGVVTSSAGADDNAKREYWVSRYHALTNEQSSLKHDLEEARKRYSRGRRANRLRGDEKGELLEDIAQLEKQLARVEKQLADFPEEARKAGALPGWFRE